MFGFLNVYKPKGKTSHDIVAILRRVSGIKQIGHTGTLDPFAEGVLPVCIGKAARLIEYLKDDKAYIGTVQFGMSTTTYDIEGSGVKYSDNTVSYEQIETCLAKFRGEIEQVPPVYSAIKVHGKKLYEYARQGEMTEIKPRKINIKKLEILDFDFKTQKLKLRIECSKGTYIRSIANDLGESLGVYGHLAELVRIKAGDFGIDDAVPVEKLRTKDGILNNLISPFEKLDYPVYELSDYEEERVTHGMSLNAQTGDGLVLMSYRGDLTATGNSNGQTIKCLKVFV